MTLKSALCWWRTGHSYVVAVGKKTLLMRCLHCQKETPGIRFDTRPRQRYEGDPQRHRLNQPRIVRRRVS